MMIRRAIPILCIALCAAAMPPSDRIVEVFEKLTNAPGPSGFEGPVRRIMVDELKPNVDKISYDGMGSVIAQQGSTGPRIMLDAHMDELGGMIRCPR
jgi:putative aminopeptidase FrvX